MVVRVIRVWDWRFHDLRFGFWREMSQALLVFFSKTVWTAPLSLDWFRTFIYRFGSISIQFNSLVQFLVILSTPINYSTECVWTGNLHGSVIFSNVLYLQAYKWIIVSMIWQAYELVLLGKNHELFRLLRRGWFSQGCGKWWTVCCKKPWTRSASGIIYIVCNT